MIFVAGFDPEEINPPVSYLIERCPIIFASKRFHNNLPKTLEQRLHNIVPIDKMIQTLKNLPPSQDAIVLTSGDPLFFGIGRRLLKELPKERLTFYPALTTVQKACARFTLPWDDMDFVSLHGKKGNGYQILIEKIISKSPFKVAVFTDHKNPPNKIAKSLNKRGLEKARFLVAQDIGGPNEAFRDMSLKDTMDSSFHPLNLLIITGKHSRNGLGFGRPEAFFHHEKGLITKPEIRSIVLSKLRLPSHGVMWDIGAGSGSVSMEASVISPGLEIFAIEKQQSRCQHIAKNKKRFLGLNIELVCAEAPQCLGKLPRPDRIFIGGGISSEGLIETAWQYLKDEGILVTSIILLESLQRTLNFFRSRGTAFELVQVGINRAKRLGQGTYLEPSPMISVVTVCKGEKAS